MNTDDIYFGSDLTLRERVSAQRHGLKGWHCDLASLLLFSQHKLDSIERRRAIQNEIQSHGISKLSSFFFFLPSSVKLFAINSIDLSILQITSFARGSMVI